MGFIEAVKGCLTSRYASFTGRATRSEYWYFFLFNFIALLLAKIIGFAISPPAAALLSLPVSLALLLPGISVGARRLHDLDKTGWWLLLWLIPVLGWIVLIVWFCMAGREGENRFGSTPLVTQAA